MFLRLRGGRLCNVDLNLLCDGFLQKLGYVPAVSTLAGLKLTLKASLRQAEKRGESPLSFRLHGSVVPACWDALQGRHAKALGCSDNKPCHKP